MSSRLLEYELKTRLRAIGAAPQSQAAASELMARVSMIEMVTSVLGDASYPASVRLRTLDALHLASASFLRAQGVAVEIATYDSRLAQAAVECGFELFPLGLE